MAKFVDSATDAWQVDLTIGGVNRAKSLLGVDLLDPLGQNPGELPLLTRLELDIALLINVVFCLVKPQADHRGITDEQFGERLGGPAVNALRKAFWETFHDFFLSLGRTEVTQAIQQQQTLLTKAIALASTKVERAGLLSHQQLDRSESSPTSSPAPPESAPNHTPSANFSPLPAEPWTETPSSAA